MKHANHFNRLLAVTAVPCFGDFLLLGAGVSLNSYEFTSCSIHIGIPASVAVPKCEEKRNEEIYGDVSLTYPANAVVSE